ncbi:homoserine kinase [Helicobacter fennelliae]|uniref:Homoserine kinase n=2 Tax=Helicobacter fennelliae TaxID=215 RepID=T1DX79_9HELI|nr:homoserine kinase [Helicobacter fennelliae]GAD20022.1 homoserine kinase [Helicobacter fennelliae MRY12-0050]SQB98208.1 homoserine kinase [Helicobacter fennelliae]STP07744.1 homoserine kinase [Helicobacter fennelliae]STQ84572.1 homoserine kinase [Helicobacter fennelliae]
MTISVPATTANLGPGFDCLGLSLEFRNEFKLLPAQNTSVQIYGEGEGVERFLIDNMFVKIFRKTLKELSIPKQHFSFIFTNQIPVSRGMGSSSAVIIGAISAAYMLAGIPLDKNKILENALVYEHHPDNITPAIFGGFNIAVLDTYQNQKKVYHSTHKMPSFLRAVMVIPGRSISTKYSRQTLPKKYTTTEAVFNLSRASLLSAAFIKGEWELLRVASKDRFHQERRMRNFPILFSVQKCALENGALMSTLSGSGSSFFNLCYEDDVNRLKDALQKRFYNFRIVDMKLDNEGLQILPNQE